MGTRPPLLRAQDLHTGAGLLTDKQAARLTALFADDAHVEVEATWGIYQRMIAAYRHEDRCRGRESMVNRWGVDGWHVIRGPKRHG